MATPHLVRGPFVRWPRTADAVLAALVFVTTVGAVALSQLPDGDRFTASTVLDVRTGAVALVAIGAVALWWRRPRPVEVAIVAMALAVVWAIAGYGDGNDLPLMVAVYSVGRYADDRRAALAVLVAAVLVGEFGTVIDTTQRIDLLPAILLMVVPWYAGSRVRNRIEYLELLRERAARIEAEELARVRQAAAAERTRIARELHDVVAHQVSMMTVQAGAAKMIAHDDLDAAVEAMTDVEQAGRRTLTELRQLLGVLRADRDADTVDELGPQPGLGDIAQLAAALEQTGARVHTTLPDPLPDVSSAVGLSAYRIVQEATTNVLKHAGLNPSVEIAVAGEPGALIVDVANSVSRDAPLPGERTPDGGYGLAGMHERVTLLGGTFTAGPDLPGRFRVVARLPIDGTPQ